MNKIREKFLWVEVILKMYLCVILLLFSNRLYFLFKNRDYIKETINIGTYLHGFYIGWIYDNAVASYLLILTVLAYPLYKIISLSKFDKKAKYIWILETLPLFVIVSFINIMDVEYFKEFGFHMNSSVFDYSLGSTEIIGSFFSSEYSPISNILMIFFMIAIYVVFFKRTIEIYEQKSKEIEKKKDKIIKGLAEFVSSLILVTLFVFGTRGGFGSSTLNWGRAYFSKYNIVNQMTLNGTFSLGKSYYYKRKKDKIGEVKKDFTFEEASVIVKENLSINNEYNKENPLYRIVDTGKEEEKLNVIMVLLESWSAYGMKSIGGEKDLTPYFDKLSKEGVLFDNFYSQGGRSNRGIASVNISYPSPLDESITKDTIASQKPFLSLGNILKERNYNTHFIYGGDPHFDNMDGFLRFNGIDEINGVEKFAHKDRTIEWGVPDDKLFEYGIEYMKNLKEPFYVNFFTLSNHAPFDTDESFEFEDKYKDGMYKRDRAFRFSDYALEGFIEKVRNEEFAKNSVFVFVADHGINLNKYEPNDKRFFHIPMLLWSPNKNLLKEQVLSKAGSQVDILPTVMGVLGGKYESASWGQDLLQENAYNYAFVSNGNAYGFVDDKYYFVESNISGQKLYDLGGRVVEGQAERVEEYSKKIKAHRDLMYYQREKGLYGR